MGNFQICNHFFVVQDNKCRPHLLKNVSNAAGSEPVIESSGI